MSISADPRWSSFETDARIGVGVTNWECGDVGELSRAVVDRTRALARLDADSLMALGTAVRAGRNRGEPWQRLQVDAMALVWEALRRTRGAPPDDWVLSAGVAMWSGGVVELPHFGGEIRPMSFPLCCHAFDDKGVHAVFVDDRLAERGRAELGMVFGQLGLSVEVLRDGGDRERRRAAYAADITCGSYSRFAHDYLRDSLEVSVDAMVGRPRYAAVVSMADFVLLDRSRDKMSLTAPYGKRSMSVDDALGRIVDVAGMDDPPAGMYRAVRDRERAVEVGGSLEVSVTVRSYFREYPRLAGVTSVVGSWDRELQDGYGFRVFRMAAEEEPSWARLPDLVYKDSEARESAVVRFVEAGIAGCWSLDDRGLLRGR